MPSGLELINRSVDSSTILEAAATALSRIPKQLQDAVPSCARACLSDYITEQYNKACTGSDCICGVYSTGLFTLGELALKCAKGPDCSGQTVSEQAASSAYNLCSQEAGAVPGLYTTLTVLQSTRTVSASITYSSAAATSVQSSSHASSARTSLQPSAAQTTLSTMSSTSSPTPTSGIATPDTAAHVRSDESHALTSAQAVGVAIGAVSGVIIIFAVIYVLACIRRRRSKRHNAQKHSYDFIDESPAKYLPSTHESFGSRAPLSELLAPRSKPLNEKHSTLWPSPAFAAGWPRAEQGELHSRSGSQDQVNTRSSESILSNASIRTVSQLLPERPGSKPPPPQFKSTNAPSIQTPATIFEEDHNASLPRTMLPGLPAHPAVLRARQPRVHEIASQPVLSIQIPQQKNRAPSTHNLTDWPLPPPPARIAPYNDESLSGGSAAFSSSKTSLLDYYASADSGSSPQELNSPTPIEETTQVRRPAPAAILITQPSYQPRATRDSVNSDVSRRTSFESTNGDEITPPEEDDKRLSPVAESPISNVRYPRVPRSSNQAVPRSPVYRGTMSQCPPATSSREVVRKTDQNLSMHKPTGSSSTLAARRRGDQLEHLHISSSAYDYRNNSSNSAGSERQLCSQRQQSPLKGYGRTKSQPRTVPSHPLTVKTRSAGSLKSPLWEPKMTPSRKGDDLYLSVSVATPQDSHFHELYDQR